MTGSMPQELDALSSQPMSELRRDGDLILSGSGGYLDDLPFENLAHAAILRSPHPHAKIVSVDASRAAAADGVLAVITGRDLVLEVNPLPHFFDPAIFDLPTATFYALATDKVRWVGEPVVAVAAATLAQAEAALELVDVEYEVLPHVIEAQDALRAGAPLLFDHWSDNVLAMFPFEEGDAESAIESSPHSLRDTLSVQRFQTAPMEGRGYVGQWERGDRITLHASTQNPHLVRTGLATTLGISEANIRVVQPRVGGGFGHKFNGYQEESLVCLLSRRAARPVKWLETREEGLLIGAREFEHEFRVGFESDGVINGITCTSIGNVGCLSTWGGWSMTYPHGMVFPGPYRIKHYKVESYSVVTNKAPWNGARGYGKESSALVIELIVDLVAKSLGIDPVEVHRVNFIGAQELPYWTQAKHLDSGDYAGALDKVLELSGYRELRSAQKSRPRDANLLGIGVAFELTPEGGDFGGSFVRGHDTSTVRVSPTGTVTVLTGVTSPGTGNETSIAAVVAREFGIHPSGVRVLQGDTDTSPFGFGNFSSRSLTAGGGAAVKAARRIKAQLTEGAAVLMSIAHADVEFAGGLVFSRLDPENSINFAFLCDQVFRHSFVNPDLTHPQLEATYTDRPDNFTHVPNAEGNMSAYPNFPYSAHVAVVEIDRETGCPTLRDYSCVHDCGVVINKVFVDGQLNGAIAMGVGGALLEELPFSADGHPQAVTFKQYLLPRATDLPRIRLGSQVTPSPFTVLGSKGAGESGVGGALASVTIAVNDALHPLGVSVRSLPLTPSKILDAIVKSGAQA
jgi:carbon-monoxide dehydrogenase large subunit